MGAGQSKEELLYQEVQNGNHDAVKALRRDGASLEWVDKEGRTPLILACTRGELLDMAITLLQLGANMNAYRPGTHGGFPLHHAAKRGLEKTVTLLLSRGADPLAINDDGQTPLEMARSRGHVSVVRLLEEQLSLFSGMLRELSGFGILETIAPNLVTKKIWAVVLPTESHPRRAPKYELAIYQSPKVSLWNGVRPSSSHPAGLCNVPQPRTTISLAKAEIEEPKFNSADPVLYITDKTNKTKYKFLSENEGDKAQLERLYRACRGIPQVQGGIIPINSHGVPIPVYPHGNPSQIHPVTPQQNGAPAPTRQPVLQSVSAPSANISGPAKLTPPAAAPIPEELALAMALDASIRSATEEGIPLSPNAQNSSRSDYKGWDVPEGSYKGWGPPDPKKQQKKPKETSYGGWEGEERNTYNGWGGPAEAGPSRTQTPPSQSASGPSKEGVSSSVQSATATLVAPPSAPPSAPPLPYVPAVNDGPIRYPTVDIAQVEMDSLSVQQSTNADGKVDDKAGGMCVVCWDAPSEGACIPCGHLAGCMNCLSEIKGKKWGCPVCRAQIEQVVKVYAV